MLFHERYELLALRGGNKELALPGREITTGRAVLVHLMAAGYTPENQELLKSIDRLSAEDRKLILESGDHEGIPFVVTEMLPRDQALREWVTAVLTAPSPPVTTERLSQGGVWKVPIAREANPQNAPPAAPPPPVAAGSEPGEFTRLFQSAPSPASDDRAAPEPGEFTRLFRSVAGSEEASTVNEVEAAAEPSRDEAVTATMALPVLHPDKPPAEPAPGEFTRVLQGQAPAPAAALEPPTLPPEPAPGEFTRLLQAEPERRATSEGESTRVFQAPPPSPPPPPLPPSAQGEFTRMMQSPLAPGPMRSTPPPAPQATPGGFTQMLNAGDPGSLPPRPPEPPKAAVSAPKGGGFQAPGEFTRMFGSEPQAREEIPPPQAPLPFPQGGAATGAFERRATPASIKAGPGEYTRMFSSPAAASPQAKAPAAPQQAAAPPPAKSNISLVLILAGLFVLAVILILVLVLTK